MNRRFVLQEVMTQIQMDIESKLKFNSFQASRLPLSNKVKASSANEPFFSVISKIPFFNPNFSANFGPIAMCKKGFCKNQRIAESWSFETSKEL